jgi:hypothetical protein
MHVRGLAAARAFDVDDRHHFIRHIVDRKVPAGFEEDDVTRVKAGGTSRGSPRAEAGARRR